MKIIQACRWETSYIRRHTSRARFSFFENISFLDVTTHTERGYKNTLLSNSLWPGALLIVCRGIKSFQIIRPRSSQCLARGGTSRFHAFYAIATLQKSNYFVQLWSTNDSVRTHESRWMRSSLTCFEDAPQSAEIFTAAIAGT